MLKTVFYSCDVNESTDIISCSKVIWVKGPIEMNYTFIYFSKILYPCTFHSFITTLIPSN